MTTTIAPRRRGSGVRRAARVAEYASLRAAGLTISAAASRVGVSERQGWRYETELAGPRRRRAATRNARRGEYVPRQVRLADYAHLRTQGLSVTAAAKRLGVCVRTGNRYEASLAAAGSAPWRPVPAPVPLPRQAVTAITPRGGCGTFLGALLHQARNERPCPSCAAAETSLRAQQPGLYGQEAA